MSYLLFLACPVSMGLMMWMMMRGGHRSTVDNEASRIAQLEEEIAELKAQDTTAPADEHELVTTRR